jgi:hypothetical protein
MSYMNNSGVNNPMQHLEPFNYAPNTLQMDSINVGQPSQNPPIESLALPDLMKNPHVQAMFNNWKDASNQVVQTAQMQQTLWQENCRLNAEINALQANRQENM